MTSQQNAMRCSAMVRAERMRVLREIEAADKPAAKAMVCRMLDGPAPEIAGVRVGRLLRSIPRFGRGRTAGMLRHAGIVSADRYVGDLTARQRRMLAEAVMLRPSEFRTAIPTPALSAWHRRSAVAALRACRPDVSDPEDVVEIVLGEVPCIVGEQAAA